MEKLGRKRKIEEGGKLGSLPYLNDVSNAGKYLIDNENLTFKKTHNKRKRSKQMKTNRMCDELTEKEKVITKNKYFDSTQKEKQRCLSFQNGHLKSDKTQQFNGTVGCTVVDTSEKEALDHKSKNLKRTSNFKDRLRNKLESGRFRWINEKLYTSTSDCAFKLFENDPALFEVYHQGFSSQVQKWPVNPVDEIINWIKERSPELVIADMGCGEAKVAQSVKNQVFSFDLVAANNSVTVCDMAKVPLRNKSVHVVIYCLSLMGTNLTEFLKEARRILKNGGIMKVAEVVSRFDDIKQFEEEVCRLGFSLINKDMTNKMFVQFDFKKSSQKRDPLNAISLSLKPCLYKKR